MEKKEMLGVRVKPSVAKRRRKVAAGGGGGGRGFAKAIAEYLASNSYMYAPLVSDPPQPQHLPPQVKANASHSLEKEATLVQKYNGS